MSTADAPELPLRGIGKSPAAFRTIAEVAVELDLPQHVLRFWETKFPQIKPLKRRGGRRYYRPADIELLREIKRLLHEDGFTIRGAQKFLREQGAAGPRTSPRPGSTAAAEAEEDASDQTPEERLRDETRAVLAELEAVRELLRRGHG